MFDNVVWTVWILFLILDLKIKNTFYLCFYRRAIYWIDNVNVICLISLLLYCFYSAHTDINLSKCWDLIFLNSVPCWMYHILHPITNYFYIILFNITNSQVLYANFELQLSDLMEFTDRFFRLEIVFTLYYGPCLQFTPNSLLLKCISTVSLSFMPIWC